MGACDGTVALVTGGSRGIGAAIATRLAAEGADVAVTARTLAPEPGARLAGSLVETVAAVESSGRRGLAVVADLLDAEERAGIVPAVEAVLGPVDVLVNNAAMAMYRPFEELTLDRRRRLVELDYHAPVDLAQAVVAGMRARRRGWVLNVSSVLARHPEGPPYGELGQARVGWHYGAAKAALERFTTGLAAELYDDGIAVNALSPVAGVLTAGFEVVAANVARRPGLLEPVEQMAEAALALLTGDPRVLTGRVVHSREILVELGRPVRTLDGRGVVEGAPA